MSEKRDTLWSLSYIRLLLVQVISAFSFYMIVTVLITYLTGASVGATTAMAGVISGLFSITSFVCRPFCGVITDRWNRMALLQGATLMMALGCFGYTFSGSLPLIIGARLLHGVGFAVNSTALVALATSFIPEKRLGEGIGYIGVANTIASAAAPGIGISIAHRFGEIGVFHLAGILAFAALLLLLPFSGTVPEKRRGNRKGQFFSQTRTGGTSPEKRQISGKLKTGDIFAVKVLGYCILGGLFSFTNGVISSYLLSYSRILGIANIGLYFTLNAAALFFVRPFAGKMMDRCGLKMIAYPGFLVTALSMFLLASANHWPFPAVAVIVASGVIRAVGQGSVNPALQTECIRILGVERSGVATSSFYLGGDIGQGIGPMIAGLVIGLGETEAKYYSVMFVVCGILMTVAMLLFYIMEKRMKKNGEKTDEKQDLCIER